MAKVRLNITTNLDEGSRQIKNMGEVSEATSKRIERFQNSFKNEKIEQFVEKNKRAAAAIASTRSPLEAAQTRQAGLRREMERLIRNGLDPQSAEIKKLNTEYQAAKRETDRLTESTKRQTKAFDLNQKMARNAARALGVLSVASVGIFVIGAKNAADYTKQLSNVNTMIDITAAEFEELDQQLTRVSTEFAIQKTELSAGVYQALSSGAEDLGAALDIVESSAILSRAALIDNSAAVDIVTTAMNAYGPEVIDATKATDTYFQIIKQGKINGQELAQVIGQSVSLCCR